MKPEIERYELAEAPLYNFRFDRRAFFKVLGAGLVVLGVVERADAQESGGGRRGGRPALPQDIGAWIHVGENGTVTGFTGKAEVGQNTRTALVQAIAEELRLPVASVKLVMADTDLVPWDAGTFGSRSMPDMLPQMRKVSAAARRILADRAAELGNPSLPYREIVKGQNLLKGVPIGATDLTPVSEWAVMGKPVDKVEGRGFVTGAHRFASDVKLPGMLTGQVVRPPSVGATLVSAAAGGGIVRDGAFLGVAAPNRRAAAALAVSAKPEWKTAAQPSEKDLYSLLRSTGEARTDSTRGSIEEGLAAADKKLTAVYHVAYIAHAPLEPRAAVAQWSGDKLTVWTGTQRPFGVRSELAQAFGIPETRVRVIVPDTGSGYGGKHTGEAAVEAARLAQAAGKPVKVVWSREEEFTHAYLRPAGVIEVTSGVRTDGTLTAWDFHNYNSGGSGIATLYEVPHQRVHFHRSESPLRQGSYRGLAATANHFAREVHMDEAAHAVGMDPLEFRLRNLKDPRLRTVFERAAEAFGWAKHRKGAAVGMGGGFEKGGYVATFAEITADPGLKNLRVLRVVTAFECGAIVNPDALLNQVEGGVIMGLGGALTEAVHFENGRILNPRFSRYRVPRFADMPKLETVLVNRTDLPSAGAGETPIVGIAPAIGNAIFAATGQRLRAMPLLGGDGRAS